MNWLSKIHLSGALAIGLAGCAGEDPRGARVWSAQGEAVERASTPLGSSIMIMGSWDWGSSPESRRCYAVIDEALSSRHHNPSLAFVVTQYHHPDPASTDPAALRFCHSRYFEGGKAVCPELDAAAVAQFRQSMTDCVRYAVRRGREVNGEPMSLALVPHIDDGTTAGSWRNLLPFDPDPARGADCAVDPGGSYFCSLLEPMAEAFRDGGDETTRVFFSLQGEMGATVFAHPDAYRELSARLRGIMTSGPRHLARENVQIGLALNYNRTSGNVFDADRQALARLFDKRVIDFLGVSSYGEVSYRPAPLELGNGIRFFEGELAFYDLSLPALLDAGVELHFSEFGLGGGDIRGRAADSSWKASSSPWGGVHGPYVKAQDPFQNPDLRRLQEDFYCAGLAYLSGRVPTRYPIAQAYVWNLTSWDVQGVYPFSVSAEGSYRNDRVTAWIRAHNLGLPVDCAANAGQDAPKETPGTLDDFEPYRGADTELRRMYLFDPKAIAVKRIALQRDVVRDGQTGMKMEFALGDGPWDDHAGVITKVERDWSRHGGISIFVKVTARDPAGGKKPRRLFRFGLREYTGEYWEAEVELPYDQATELALPFGRFVRPAYIDNQIGDGKQDFSHILEYSFAVGGPRVDQDEILYLDALGFLPR